MQRPVLALLLLITTGLAGCGGSGDGDGDGLYDTVERAGWTILVETMTQRERRDVTSDPKVWDTDGDGIDDLEEYTILTDPRSKDTDGDGLTDCQERFHTVASECEDPDYNGTLDGGYGTDPTKADSDAGPSRYKEDQPWQNENGGVNPYQARWGDGLSDGDEINGFTVTVGQRTRHVTTDPRRTDTDGDGLEDAEEILLFGSDPTVINTDGDACADGADPWPAHAERYSIGLQSFRLDTDMDPGGGADLRLIVVIAEHVIQAPASGSIRVQRDQVIDLTSYSPAARAMKECNQTPFAPWMPLQVLAEDQDGDSAAPIDVYSLSGNPAGAGLIREVWWNVRTGTMAWEPEGAPLTTPLRLRGVDGEITFQPRVEGVSHQAS